MKPGVHTAAYRVFAGGILCLGIAAAAYGTLQLTFGPRPVLIHVRWAPDVDDIARQEAEQRYSLSQGARLEGRTWGYTLSDLSRTNIGALVRDAVIEDTHDVDRTTFRVSPAAPRRPYPPAHAWIPLSLQGVAVLGLVIGLIGISLGLIERAAPGAVVASVQFVRHPTVVLLVGVLVLVASVWLRSGRTTANGGLGSDGELYAQVLVNGPVSNAPNQRNRPLVIFLNRPLYDWQFRATDGTNWPVQQGGVVRTFQIANVVYAAMLAILLLALLDLYGASVSMKALLLGNLFVTIAVTKMFGFYPILVDLGAYAFVTLAIYAVLCWPRGWVVLSTILAVLSREFGLVVLAFGVHRDLRLGVSWRRSLTTYVPALLIWVSLRAYVNATSTVAPVSLATAVRHLDNFLSHPLVPLFSVYFLLTVFGGVSCVLVVLAVCGRLRVREPEWITYIALVAILTLGAPDVWRYLAYMLPAVPMLFATNWRGGSLQAVVLTGITLATQQPWTPMDDRAYFEEWFPLWRLVMSASPDLSADFWPQWGLRFAAVVIGGLFFAWVVTRQR